jgi:hypothetical protein
MDMVQINASKVVKSRHLGRRSRSEATERQVVHNVLAALQVVLERVKLAAQLVVAEVELGLAVNTTGGSLGTAHGFARCPVRSLRQLTIE